MIRDTSIEAYNKIKRDGLLSERRWQVYDILYEIGPATGGEIFRHMKKKYGPTIPTNSNVTTRLGELRHFGVAMEIGKRKCTMTGQMVILWDVTSKLPLKFDKPEKTKCAHCNGTGLITKQQIKLF